MLQHELWDIKLNEILQKRKTQKVTYYMTLLIWKIQNRQIERQKDRRVDRGLAEEEREQGLLMGMGLLSSNFFLMSWIK